MRSKLIQVSSKLMLVFTSLLRKSERAPMVKSILLIRYYPIKMSLLNAIKRKRSNLQNQRNKF
jgi:hypothetical protein